MGVYKKSEHIKHGGNLNIKKYWLIKITLTCYEFITNAFFVFYLFLRLSI